MIRFPKLRIPMTETAKANTVGPRRPRTLKPAGAKRRRLRRAERRHWPQLASATTSHRRPGSHGTYTQGARRSPSCADPRRVGGRRGKRGYYPSYPSVGTA